MNTENPISATAQDETPAAEAALAAKSSLLLFGPRLGDRSAWVRYGVAVASVGAIALVRLALVPLAGTQAPLLPFVLSVYVAAYVAGLGPALFATALSVAVSASLFAHITQPIQAIAWSFHVALFLAVGVLISLITRMLQRASSAQYAALLSAREAQAQAKTSEMRLRLVADHIPALVAYIDRTEHFRFTNAAFLDWFALDGAATRKHVRDVIGDDVYELRAPHIRAALRGELVQIQGPLTHRVLGVRECEITYIPDREQNGEVRGLYVMVQDFTERFAAERALSEREYLLRTIYDSSSDGLYLMSVEPHERFRLVTVNETFLSASGYAREQVFSRPMEDVFPPANQALVREKYAEVITSRRGLVYQDKAQMPSGLRQLEIRLNPIVAADETVTHILGAITDVTPRKLAEEALQAADRRKDEFLAMLAHELRNPIAPIRNVANLLAGSAVQGSDVRRLGELLVRQTAHLTHLVDDLLEAARITRGVIELKKQVLALQDVVDAALETMQPLAALKRQIVAHERAAHPYNVFGDPARVRQVFENLLSNAVKFSPDRSTIRVFYTSAGDRVSVHVKDEGIGIDSEVLPRVFDLFMQADQSLDRNQSGLGIGLTIVKHLIELHGGAVQAHSEGSGRGSEFTVDLPLVAATLPITAPIAPAVASVRRRVLIVEDNVDSAESLALLIAAAGHEVRAMHDGVSALETLKEFMADVVLLDIGLPGIDGYVVAQEVRRRYIDRTMRLYALTGYGREEDRALALAAGFDMHLTKPLDPAQLLMLIARQGASEPTSWSGECQ